MRPACFKYLILFSVLLPISANAACSSPSGNEGDVMYNSTYHLLQYCNGTLWINAGVNSAISYGTLTTNNFCTATSGTAIACTTASTGSGNVVLSAAPTLTGTVAGVSSTWTTSVAIGTSTLSGALNVSGTATATTFSGSGASLTGLPLTTGVTGVLPVANGGTGLATLTSNAIYKGNGTSAMAVSSLTDNGTNVTTTENVGIGTATPATALEIDAAVVANRGQLSLVSTSNNSYMSLYQGTSLYGWSGLVGGNFEVTNYNSATGGNIVFKSKASAGESVRIDVNGNVGIGTTSPVSNLQIGNFTATSTASPVAISLGGTYSSTAGANAKLKVWDNGTSYYGLGVSSASLDVIGDCHRR